MSVILDAQFCTQMKRYNKCLNWKTTKSLVEQTKSTHFMILLLLSCSSCYCFVEKFQVQTPKKLQMFLHGQVELIVDWRKGVEK